MKFFAPYFQFCAAGNHPGANRVSPSGEELPLAETCTPGNRQGSSNSNGNMRAHLAQLFSA
jgi:hypothetical protein